MAAFLLLAGAVHLLPGQERADRFFDSNGVSIRFIEQGTGDPVVLIHGFGGSADDPWVKAGILQAIAITRWLTASAWRIPAFTQGSSALPPKP